MLSWTGVRPQKAMRGHRQMGAVLLAGSNMLAARRGQHRGGLVAEEGLHDGSWVGEPRGLDQHIVVLVVVNQLQHMVQHSFQLRPRAVTRAAHAPILHNKDPDGRLLLLPSPQHLVVNR